MKMALWSACCYSQTISHSNITSLFLALSTQVDGMLGIQRHRTKPLWVILASFSFLRQETDHDPWPVSFICFERNTTFLVWTNLCFTCLWQEVFCDKLTMNVEKKEINKTNPKSFNPKVSSYVNCWKISDHVIYTVTCYNVRSEIVELTPQFSSCTWMINSWFI